MTIDPKISFTKLQTHHFPLLLQWLEAPHVKAWWDQNILWTPELIEEKYSPYVEGYKLESGYDISKPMHAYIILTNYVEIGYIQYYNAYDFEREEPIAGLPQSLAAFDIFIGEEEYVGKGIGSRVLKQFCDEYIFNEFDHCLVDPDLGNLGAVKAYEKAGFTELYKAKEVVMMIKSKKEIREK